MKYFFYSIFSFIGFLVGKYITIPHFEVDNKINLVEVTGVLVTIGAAYWISNIIDKKKENSRAEKDLFLKRTDGISDIIRDFSVKVSTGSITIYEVTSTCKRIFVSIDSLYKALDSNNYHCNSIDKTYLLLSINNIKGLLTTTPTSGGTDTEIQIVSGNITVTGTKLNSIETEFETLKNRFLKFQIEINKF